MPRLNADLHGNVPDKAPVVLLLIDVINDMEFVGGDKLFRQALPAARRIARLKERAHTAKIPSIYVNDNFGKWRSDFKVHLEHCLSENTRGKQIIELLQPKPEDYFVLKPKHSGFFSSTLETLLRYLRAKTVILTGFAGNICVLFTANDAFLRDFQIYVPRDCTASNTPQENLHALKLMATVLRANTQPSSRINLSKLKHAKID